MAPSRRLDDKLKLERFTGACADGVMLSVVLATIADRAPFADRVSPVSQISALRQANQPAGCWQSGPSSAALAPASEERL